MSLYQTVKSAITVRQVGEMYGMEPDRHGMVCCPFHSDSDPSMKLNDTYYYCFGCGANGDAIDLTAKLFDLNPRQAAEKLNDFAFAKQCSPQWGLQATERSCVSKMEGPRPDKFGFVQFCWTKSSTDEFVRLWSFFVCPQRGQKMKKECKMRCA